MSANPRQGRKGNKVSASPSLPAETTPNVGMSPGSLPQADIEFDWSLLSKKAKKSKEGGEADGAAADGTSSSGAAHPEKSPKTTPAADGSSPAASPETVPAAPAVENVLKFDPEAIDVAKGVLMGANKSVKTDTRKPSASASDVAGAVRDVLQSQQTYYHRTHYASGWQEVPQASVEAVNAHDVAVVPHPQAALDLAMRLSKTGAAKVLVVVSERLEVTLTDTADGLRHALGAGAVVGTLTDPLANGPQSCNLWVASAETALMYLTSQGSLAPFTHVVLPRLTPMSCTLTYFIWGLRERVFRMSESFDRTAPPLHAVVAATPVLRAATRAFFSEQRVCSVPPQDTTPTPEKVTVFSYDEAAAYAERDVLVVQVDQSGKFLGPHYRLVDHTVKVAVAIVRKLITTATFPLHIGVMTGDGRAVCEELSALNLPNTVVHKGRRPANVSADAALGDSDASLNHVYVCGSLVCSAAVNNYCLNFVIDLGTTRQLSLLPKSEAFLSAYTTEWVSVPEMEERRTSLLGYVMPGAYFTLYPEDAATTFRADATRPHDVFHLERAFLQCARAALPLQHVGQDVLSPVAPELQREVLESLATQCVVQNSQSPLLTFVGEIVSRLPFDVDISQMVVQGCALGIGEAVAIAACVMTLPVLAATGKNAAALAASKERVLQTRKTYAGEIATQSDVLADVLVFLEWRRLSVAADPALLSNFLSGPEMDAAAFQRVNALFDETRMILADYAFLDDIASVDTVAAATQLVRTNVSALIFLSSAALSRRVCFVRESGTMGSREKSGALAFARTSKKVVADHYAASAVQWGENVALVATNLRSSGASVAISRVAALSSAYYLTSLLLLSPQVEYSSPVESVGGRGRVVHFAVSSNYQMKRFRLSVNEAAQVLDFRERLNELLGFLQALRTAPKPISRRKFNLLLIERDRSVDVAQTQREVLRQLTHLVTDIEVTEHQESFVALSVHLLAPKATAAAAAQQQQQQQQTPEPSVAASDAATAAGFRAGSLWKAEVHQQPRNESPSTLPTGVSGFGGAAAAAVEADAALSDFPLGPHPAGPHFIDDDDDDDIEVLDEDFFSRNGPLIDDDE